MEYDASSVSEVRNMQSHEAGSGTKEDTSELQQPASAFVPFFAVIENAETGDFHHPTVHYIFEDDDSSLLTSTAIDILESNTTPTHSDDAANQVAIIDLDTEGQKVVNISSISRNWQALRAELSQAPSWGENLPQSTSNGLMLKVSGKNIRESAENDSLPAGDIGELLERFDQELESLNEVMQNTERGEAD